MGDILIIVMDDAHSDSNNDVFSYKNSYMQHAIYRADNIITIDETRKAIRSLLGAFLGREETLEKIRQKVMGKGINESDFLLRLKSLGDKCPAEFRRSYEKGFVRDFKKTYTLNELLSPSEKDKLAQAEAKQKQQKKEYREKIRSKEDISTEFDDLVSGYVRRSVSKASEDLKNALGLKLDIIASDDDYEEFEED